MASTMGCDVKLQLGVVITYEIILPVLVVLGLVGSAASILVLWRSSLRNIVANKYFLALSGCDLLLSASYITIAATACGCEFNIYESAWFFAHFGWTVTCTFHALGTYIILFMSLDRFVAMWFPTWFERLTKPPFHIRNRLVFSSVLALALHVPFMVDGEVQCKEMPTSGDNCSMANLSPINCTDSTDDTYYISNDGFQKSFDMKWHKAYRYIYNPMVRWVPYALLTGLNISLVVAVCTGRVRFPRAKPKEEVRDKAAQVEAGTTRRNNKKWWRQERVLVATAIAMTASYVVLTLPITIFLATFADPNNVRCETPSPIETLRHAGNLAQMLEHVLHAVYLFFINPSFRRELLCLLRCRKSPNTDSLSDSLPNNGRPLSSVSRSSSKVCRNSVAPAQHTKPSWCDDKSTPFNSYPIEETPEEYKFLRSDAENAAEEEPTSFMSVQDSSYYSDTREETTE